ncbi:MAG: OmpA family protein [Sphingobacteriaceae bacterium]|nr:MAG: OmpA family protein [Sphingobacteriaceae bacterium]
MKRNLLLCVALLSFSVQGVNAQFLNRLKKKAEAAVNKKADAAIDNALENGTVSSKKEKPAEQSQQAEAAPQAAKSEKTEAKPEPLQAYAKYDFIPGQNFIYTDNFTGEAMGELPTGWNSKGNGAVTKLNNFPGNWMRMDQNAVYLPGKDLATTDNFTVEFDMVLDLKSKGYGFPDIFIGMISTGKLPAGDNSFLTEQYGSKSFHFDISPGSSGSTNLRFASEKGRTVYFRSPVRSYKALENYYGKVSHIAIQAQKERLRLWMNGEKIIDASKALPVGEVLNQLFFRISSSNYAQQDLGIYVGNISVAQGAPDLRNKLVNEGRFSTSGILFDVNAATIKPESAGVLQEIANVLKENPTINISITGHTDSDGNAAANQKLSVNRAESVKSALAETYGISVTRMQVAGKGASQPIASNKTETGKAQNRRVEFIKL